MKKYDYSFIRNQILDILLKDSVTHVDELKALGQTINLLDEFEEGNIVCVTRCKDCISWDKDIQFMGACACDYWSESKAQHRKTNPNEYCFMGYRREDEKDNV